MIDIHALRENPEHFIRGAKRKGYDVDIDAILTLDATHRELIGEVESLRKESNDIAKKGASVSEEDRARGKQLKTQIKTKQEERKAVEEQLTKRLLSVPNVPLDEVPDGGEEDKKILREWGDIPTHDFDVKDHVELGEALDIIDLKTAAAVTGARFAYLKNEAVWLEFALIRLAFDTLTNPAIIKSLAQEVGDQCAPTPFTPVLPPHMIRPDTYTRMARLSEEDKDERFYLERDDLYLIGSAEHTLGPMHMDSILEAEHLPIRYVGFSSSYRREAGSYGKDTRGILRVHQFDKVEMESIATPEQSMAEHELFIAIQEHLMQQLNIPYRVALLAARDMSAPNARQVDIEAWIPSQKTYRETHTADYVTDFQARRLNTRVKQSNGSIVEAHMNDATVFAIGRTLIALLENFQQEDGSVNIPKALHPYLHFTAIPTRNA